MMTDPIADMLPRIRNSIAVGHEQVEMPLSKLREGIAKILVVEGYIDRYETAGEGVQQNLILFLRYGPRRSPVIAGLRRVSRPGHRVYRQASEIPRVQGGLGITIISTSNGLMTAKEAARKGGGGEVVALVW